MASAGNTFDLDLKAWPKSDYRAFVEELRQRLISLGFDAVFWVARLSSNTAVTVAAIGEIQRPGRMLPNHRPLAAIRLVAPHAGFVPVLCSLAYT